MQPPNIWIAWRENPHSARYRLHHGISGALLQVVPWLNVVLVAALFLVVSGRITVAPGIVFDLPKASLAEGVHDDARAVLLTPAPGGPALAFFADVRYRIDSEDECARLAGAIRQAQDRDGWKTLVLYAARDVPHGDVMRFVSIARDAGVRAVNVAIKPEE